MTTTNQSKRYLGNRSIYSGPDLPETDLEEGFLFFKTNEGGGGPGPGGGGDVSSNTSLSVIDEIALFSDTTGKEIKRATGTGIAKITSGVLGTVVSGTDIKTINGQSILGSGNLTISGGSGVDSFNTRVGPVTLQASDITPIDGSGSGIDADLLDGQHASAFALSGHTHTGQYLSSDMGYNNVGSICFVKNTSTFFYTPGATFSGSLLWPAAVVSFNAEPQVVYYPSTLPGTWRILGGGDGSGVGTVTLAQRIA